MITPENINLALHGQIGKIYIYWTVHGTQFKRPYKIPYDPKTESQITQREKFSAAAQTWNELTEEQKQEWEEKVKKRQVVMTAYNYYIQKKMLE